MDPKYTKSDIYKGLSKQDEDMAKRSRPTTLIKRRKRGQIRANGPDLQRVASSN